MTHPRTPRNGQDDAGLGILDTGTATATSEESPGFRWKPVPAIILAAAAVYSVTVVVGSVTFVVVDAGRNSVARACIEAGGEWVISESGDRECKQKELR